MNKIAKALFMALTAATVGCAFADVVAIPFVSSGETYGDGTTVLDGEWYVLCWSPNATFGGFDDTLTPKVSGDKVITAVPFAKDGGACIIFNVTDSMGIKDGYFFVYLLDTRVSATALAPAVGGRPDPSQVKGAVVAKALANPATAAEGAEAEVASGLSTAVVSEADAAKFALVEGENLTPARITGISFTDDGYAVITVSDMNPYLTYIVKSGSSLKTITATQVTAPAQKGAFDKGLKADFKFVIDKAEAQFFQVFLAE